jgi:gliding motility-associated-like protein
MKKATLYFLFMFMILQTVSAQITYTFLQRDVQCNNSALGKIQLDITSSGSYTFLWSSGQTTSTIMDVPAGTYDVLVTDTSSVDTTISFTIKTEICHMSGALVFTPNSDGINDTWTIGNYQYFPDAWVMIYNRLGQRVFEHKGLYEPWDGKDLFGNTVPDASYFYIIYEDKSDEKSIIKGSVSIIK